MLHMTKKQYEAYMKKLGLPPVKTPKEPSKQKYRNIRVYVYEDGFISYGIRETVHGAVIEKFDSIKEYKRCNELRMLERAGVIKNLQLQVPMVIQDSFVDNEGVRQRAIIYKADFTYEENGFEIVEDVKGFDYKTNKFLCTRAFQQKWKLLKALYPQKKFRLY